MTAGRARGWKRATRDHALLRVLSDSDLPRLGGDDGAPREFFGITRQDLQTCAPLVCGAEADQAHNAAMRKPSQDSQLPKILVDGDHDAPLVLRPDKDFLVAGIRGPVPGPYHVVPGSFEFSFGLGTDARVQENLQEPTSMESGSMRSLAAIRRA